MAEERRQLVEAVREIMIAYYMTFGRWPTTTEIEAQLDGKRGW